MNWQTKARILSALDRLPMRDAMHYFVQRNITRTLPRKDKPDYFDNLDWHRSALTQEVGALGDVRLFEFGAGWDLFYNIYLYASGVGAQTLVDLNSHAKIDLINHEIARCRSAQDASLVRRPDGPISTLDDLQRFGIDYVAPCDARDTPFESGAFNAVISTNTMEHVTFADLAEILRECHRILEPGGIVSAKIDYADHYYYVDKSISPYNYMTYSDAEWQRFNPASHFQNRGRHSGYIALFETAGFTLVEAEPVFDYPDIAPPDRNARSDIFRDLTETDLKATSGRFLARKK